MRDPFEPPNIHKNQKEYTVDDFLVIGSNCHICSQQICIDEVILFFFKKFEFLRSVAFFITTIIALCAQNAK